MSLDNSHILLCRTDNIGDVVLTLPLAGYLRRRFPDARIGFLCRSYAAGMVRQCSAIDYVVESDRLGDFPTRLVESGVDTILFGKPDRRLAAMAWTARVKRRVGTSHRWYHWLYCNRLAHFSRVKSDLHEAQLNFALLKPLGIDHIPALEEIKQLYGLSAPHNEAVAREFGAAGFNLILHPKSNGNGREWPIGHYAELARLLSADAGIRIWITGSTAEGEWLQQHGGDLLAQPNVRSVCGRYTLGELSSFIAQAGGLVASGTGPLHLSAALGQRTLGLFPPIKPIDPARWGALGPRAQVLCRSRPCAGCPDPAACTCMADLAPQQVADVVRQWRRTAMQESEESRP
jgi:ADP-heptose:LPS heptosyltransferase